MRAVCVLVTFSTLAVRALVLQAQARSAPTDMLDGTVPKTTRRLVGRHVGSSFREVAHVVESPLPELEEGQVLVKMTHVGVNGGCETFRARGEHWCGTKQYA
jgi:hypothetical protein